VGIEHSMSEVVRASLSNDLAAIDGFVSSPDFFRLLFEQLYEGVYFVDRHRRILYWNRAAHRISGYAPDEVVGHYCQDNLLNHVDDAGTQFCFGKCPLMTSIETGLPHECQMYLHHKQGHRVPVVVRVAPVRDAGGSVVGAVEMFLETGSTQARNQRLESLQSRGLLDPLTELGNRRYLEVELFRAIQDFRQHGLTFGAILADIDHLRVINEHYGHTVGDQALHSVAGTLSNCVDDSHVLGRWSVDEFLILAPGSSPAELSVVAERCRALVERSSIQAGAEQVVVTMSAGVSCFDALDTMESFVRRLESLLQRSKYSGRNHVTAKQAGES
jgi:diguanylate cyclase (GGDEF)-like protein/PAS domain S-box-containing protein